MHQGKALIALLRELSRNADVLASEFQVSLSLPPVQGQVVELILDGQITNLHEWYEQLEILILQALVSADFGKDNLVRLLGYSSDREGYNSMKSYLHRRGIKLSKQGEKQHGR